MLRRIERHRSGANDASTRWSRCYSDAQCHAILKWPMLFGLRTTRSVLRRDDCMRHECQRHGLDYEPSLGSRWRSCPNKNDSYRGECVSWCAPRSCSCPPRTLLPLNLTLRGTCQVVTSLWTTVGEALDLPALVPNGCTIVAYDRRETVRPCEDVPSTMACTALPNVPGMDATHTWAHHVAANYHKLPRYIFFVPSSLSGHFRWNHLRHELLTTGFGAAEARSSFACVRAVRSCDGFEHLQPPVPLFSRDFAGASMRFYGRANVTPARMRPLAVWLFGHLPEGAPSMARVCHYSAFATTAANLRARPRRFYTRLKQEWSATRSMSEVSWYVEWAAEVLFGPGLSHSPRTNRTRGNRFERFASWFASVYGVPFQLAAGGRNHQAAIARVRRFV